ncbi:MAG: DNA gyrase inhibitor YacG [Bryobacteraceae bacterium]
MIFRCPICRKPVEQGGADFPFCGERCRLLDLGNWATDKYVIPGAPAPPSKPPEGDEAED